MRDAFPEEGSTLQRYAARFSAAEINATFYKPPREATLRRWAESTPDGFHFSLKVPRAISHEARLADVADGTDAFLEIARMLGDRAGPLLLQLPPSLAFDPLVAGPACERLQSAGLPLVCEPRHASWFTPQADAWLAERRVARVAADPARHAGAEAPGGWRGLTYVRLHGSPRMYWSPYTAEALAALATRLQSDPAPEHWCIFDNTASGAAAANALALRARLGSPAEG